MNRQHQRFGLLGRIVGQGNLERTHHTHGARRPGVQIFPYGVLQHAHIHGTASLVDPHHVAEGADRFRCVATATHTGNSRHPRIVPAFYKILIHQTLQFALAGNGVVQVQPGEFDLARMTRARNVVQNPVVERTVVLEFQGAQGVGDVFNRIRD